MLAIPAALVATTAVHAATSPRDYVMTAGASDLYERQSSQLVADTTRNAKLRAFVRDMIRDHTKSTTLVKQAAMRARMRVTPPMLTPDQRTMMAQLRAAHGAERDTLYISQQRTAHDQALALHQDYARSGSVPSLRTAASQIVPVVRHHIAMLQSM
ncbi:MAG: DUF4142 domain-containing protein [Sphingomonas sp.]|nr:DUF4142 domain-containing protein [Sphingomonas sp.]